MGGSKAPWLFSDTQTGCALHPQRVAVAPFPQLSLAPQLSCAHSCWPSHTPVKKVASYCPCSWRGSGDADTPRQLLCGTPVPVPSCSSPLLRGLWAVPPQHGFLSGWKTSWEAHVCRSLPIPLGPTSHSYVDTCNCSSFH